MKKIELYSFKAEVYSSLLFDKKKKKGGQEKEKNLTIINIKIKSKI